MTDRARSVGEIVTVTVLVPCPFGPAGTVRDVGDSDALRRAEDRGWVFVDDHPSTAARSSTVRDEPPWAGVAGFGTAEPVDSPVSDDADLPDDSPSEGPTSP